MLLATCRWTDCFRGIADLWNFASLLILVGSYSGKQPSFLVLPLLLPSVSSFCWWFLVTNHPWGTIVHIVNHQHDVLFCFLFLLVLGIWPPSDFSIININQRGIHTSKWLDYSGEMSQVSGQQMGKKFGDFAQMWCIVMKDMLMLACWAPGWKCRLVDVMRITCWTLEALDNTNFTASLMSTWPFLTLGSIICFWAS